GQWLPEKNLRRERMQLSIAVIFQTLLRISSSKLQVRFLRASQLTTAANTLAFFPCPSFPRDEQKLKRPFPVPLRIQKIFPVRLGSIHLHAIRFEFHATRFSYIVPVL